MPQEDETQEQKVPESNASETSKGLASVIEIGKLTEACSHAGEDGHDSPELTYIQRTQIAEYLRQNSEVETYENFKPGDTVVTFTSTTLGEEFDEDGSIKENLYSAKWMNDNISHEFVNGLASLRDYAVYSAYGGDLRVVTSTFKLCSARVCNETGANPDERIVKLNQMYVSMVQTWAEEYIKNPGLSEKQTRSLGILLEALRNHPDIGLVCGKAKVAEESPFATEMDHYRNVRLALVQSTIEAKAKDYQPGEVHLSYEDGLISDRAYFVMERAESIARKYFDRIIRDRFGREYRPFHIAYDDDMNRYYKMDRGLAFALRKGEFRPDNSIFAEALELRTYLRMVNILDAVAYHTQEDLEDPEFCEHIKQRKEMIALLMSGKPLSSEDMRLAGKLMSENILFHNIQSSAVFHHVASERNTGTYLSFDFIGVGIENVLDCERTMQRLLKIRRLSPPNAEEITREILVTRGDKVTVGIRKRINTIMACLAESGTPPVVAERSGDEIRVFVDKDPDSALLAHINSLNTRVSKIPVNGDRRDSPDRVADHGKYLDYIGTAEDYSKYLELMLRYLETFPDNRKFDSYRELVSSSNGFYVEGNCVANRANICFVQKDGSLVRISDAQFVQDFMNLYVGIFK